jgi:hypothetical protein
MVDYSIFRNMTISKMSIDRMAARGLSCAFPVSHEIPTLPSAGSALRVPLLQTCRLEVGELRLPAFVVNINVLGAYVSAENAPFLSLFPRLGDPVVCWLRRDGEVEMPIRGTVAWINTQRRAPRLPPGFGIRFEPLADDDRRWIERMVEEYVRWQPRRPL